LYLNDKFIYSLIFGDNGYLRITERDFKQNFIDRFLT